MQRSHTTLNRLVITYAEERLRSGELGAETARGTSNTLLRFAAVVGEDLEVRLLAERHIRKWLASRAGLAPATVRTQLSAIRSFCRWARAKGILRDDPTLGVRGPRQPRTIPRGLRMEQVIASFAGLPDERAEAVLSLMVQEGLRCCEVVRLELGDVDMGDGVIRVRGKGGHERILPLSSETRSAISRYLSSYPCKNGPLIRSYRNPSKGIGAHFLSGMVREWLTEAGVKTGAYDRITAHAFRHTALSDMLNNGAELRDVQAAAGHVSIATTQIYLPMVVKGLREAMGGRSYRAVTAAESAENQSAAS